MNMTRTEFADLPIAWTLYKPDRYIGKVQFAGTTYIVIEEDGQKKTANFLTIHNMYRGHGMSHRDAAIATNKLKSSLPFIELI